VEVITIGDTDANEPRIALRACRH